MDIAILGGTGDIGAGLALRWAHDSTHAIRIGSRSEEKAHAAVDRYVTELAPYDISPAIRGGENSDVTPGADVVVLAVPPYHVRSLLDTVSNALAQESIVVSPAVGMKRTEAGFVYDPPATGSLTELVAESAPESVRVVGAFHTLPAARLADLDASLDMDTFVLADEPDARDRIMELAEAIDGLRAVDAGGLACAGAVESITPLLVTAAHRSAAFNEAGVRLV